MNVKIVKILLVAVISISLLPGCIVTERGCHYHHYRHHEPPRYYGHY
jgi:hypothetical protein